MFCFYSSHISFLSQEALKWIHEPVYIHAGIFLADNQAGPFSGKIAF